VKPKSRFFSFARSTASTARRACGFVLSFTKAPPEKYLLKIYNYFDAAVHRSETSHFKPYYPSMTLIFVCKSAVLHINYNTQADIHRLYWIYESKKIFYNL